MKKLIYGVGVNDADYPISRYEKIGGKTKQVWMCPFYQSWLNMFKRVYSKKIHNTYDSANIRQEWWLFSTYKAWMETQPWEGNELDKDLLIVGNKEYGPATCTFIPQYLNKFLTDSGASRGIYPQGVYFHKASGKFLAQCHDKKAGQQVYLGLFEDSEVAHVEWKKYKYRLAIEYAEELSGLGYDLKIIQALKDRFNYQEGK
jgi:hypothetical protein